MQRISPIRVFALDDHPIITAGLASIINHQTSLQLVGVAHSRQEMMTKLAKSKPHVLVLDLNIPGSDFYDNIQFIKEVCPWVKILVYTSYYGPELSKSLRKEGVLGYLLKGALPAEIYEAVQTVFRGEQYLPTPPKTIFEKAKDGGSSPSDDFRKRLSLSRREQEILALISKGLTSQNIGKQLFISKHTVETHRKNILRKLDFSSSTELVKFAVQQGLV